MPAFDLIYWIGLIAESANPLPLPIILICVPDLTEKY
jgi:hypothetical protein